jgi:hypothetical protein
MKHKQAQDQNDSNFANEELKKTSPEELTKAHDHAKAALDYDYQDHDSYEQPIRNSQRGYAPIDVDKTETES